MKLTNPNETLHGLSPLISATSLMNRHLVFVGALLTLGTGISPLMKTAHATEIAQQEIVVTDCDGVTRAQVKSDRGMPYDLHVTLSPDQISVAEMVLTSGDKRREAAVHRGAASFGRISSGIYQICGQSQAAKIATISIEPSAEDRSLTVGGIVAGAAALGGTALALNSSGSEGDPSPSTTNTLAGSTSAAAGPARPAAPATSSSSGNDRDCLNGAKVNPISPFD